MYQDAVREGILCQIFLDPAQLSEVDDGASSYCAAVGFEQQHGPLPRDGD